MEILLAELTNIQAKNTINKITYITEDGRNALHYSSCIPVKVYIHALMFFLGSRGKFPSGHPSFQLCEDSVLATNNCQ
jgi:hypothetical protein